MTKKQGQRSKLPLLLMFFTDRYQLIEEREANDQYTAHNLQNRYGFIQG